MNAEDEETYRHFLETADEEVAVPLGCHQEYKNNAHTCKYSVSGGSGSGSDDDKSGGGGGGGGGGDDKDGDGEDDDDKKSGKGPSTVVIALIVGFSSLLIGLVVGKFCFATQQNKYEFKQSSMLG